VRRSVGARRLLGKLEVAVTDERPPEVGWLHYRLVVAVCSAFVTGIMLLLVPLIVSMSTAAPQLFVIYKFVFSKWGAATLLGSAVIGFLVGGERMANFFAIIWGTHPFWSKLEGWLYELGGWLDDHKTVGTFLAIAIGLLVVGVFWYSFP